jgi:hypothetical protein
MAQGLQFTCPVCGWTVITPKGEEDLMKHVDMHGTEYHVAMAMDPDQIIRMTKTVNMPEPMKPRM